MSFLHWWAIGLGIAALAAPLAVHFLTKPKPIARPFSTVRFLQEVIEQRKARSRLRDWLLLALRALCIALLALSLARPILRSPPMVATQATGETSRIVVLDVSQSMEAGSGGVTSWSQAQAAAVEYLSLGNEAEANVILAGARPRGVFDSLSPNFNALREAVKQAKPLAERCNPREAMDMAGRMLSQVTGVKKELVIISDFQRGNWGASFLDPVPADVNIQYFSVAQSNAGNVAINTVRFGSEPIVGQSNTLEVELANYSEQEVLARCRVDLSGTQRSFEAKLAPQSTQTVSESIQFDQIGWKYGWAKLENNFDSLPKDDERPVTIRVRPSVKVLLLTRQSNQEVPSSSFYLENAIRVGLIGTVEQSDDAKPNGPQSFTRIHPQKSPPRNWPESDVFIIDHPGALSQDMLQYIASQLRRGKGLLYVTSELVDAVNVEQLSVILGGDFQPPVTLHPLDPGRQRKELFIQRIETRQSPFLVLGATTASPLSSIRISGGLSTRATSEGLKDQVLAELSDTSTLLYLSGVGAGQIAIINADLGRSNWPMHPTFLPVLSELTQQLISSRGQSQQAYCGEPMVRLLPPSVSEANGLTPKTIEGNPPQDDRYGQWEWSASQGAVVWSWPEPAGSGVYSLDSTDGPAWMVASSAPEIEADLATLDESVLTERVTDDRAVGFRSNQSQESSSDDIWNWLIIGCLVGLIAEIIALRFSRM